MAQKLVGPGRPDDNRDMRPQAAVIIRPLRPAEQAVLWRFLYLSIHVPPGSISFPLAPDNPALRLYRRFGFSVACEEANAKTMIRHLRPD